MCGNNFHSECLDLLEFCIDWLLFNCFRAALNAARFVSTAVLPGFCFQLKVCLEVQKFDDVRSVCTAALKTTVLLDKQTMYRASHIFTCCL